VAWVNFLLTFIATLAATLLLAALTYREVEVVGRVRMCKLFRPRSEQSPRSNRTTTRLDSICTRFPDTLLTVDLVCNLDSPADGRGATSQFNEVSMIERYSDHAANERTFLAWVRTGIATIAFGFVVEKFNLFVRTIVEANASDSATRLHLERFSGAFSHYDGLALIVIGMAIIILSLVRFVRTSRMIDDPWPHTAGGIKVELVLAVILGLIVMSMTAYFSL
jgi:putative membrane protein